MPGYKTHISASSFSGTVLGVISFFIGNVNLASSIYGGTLCAIGGLVPDIDSKTSTSFRRCLAIVAGFSSLLLVSRLRDYMLDPQTVALIGGGNFLLIWTFLGGIIQKTTVHRGMCHSIPMAILTGEIAFLLSSGNINERLFCGAAAMLGVLVHLTLDEIYSFQVKGGTIKVKKSLGSALKIANFDDKKSTFIMFIILGFTTMATLREPIWNDSIVGEKTEIQRREYRRTGAGDMLQKLQIENPDLYDLSVIDWAVTNDMQISPRTDGNPKWEHIQSLLSDSSAGSETAESPSLFDLLNHEFGGNQQKTGTGLSSNSDSAN